MVWVWVVLVVLVVLPCCWVLSRVAIDRPGAQGQGYSPRAFAMISVATLVGTWAYEWNCME